MELVKDKVWNGAVNVRIEFSDAHYLLLVYRLLYFPLYYPHVVQFFSDITGSDLSATPVWLEYEDVPLKWNLPVGVLYDLLYLLGKKNPRDPWVLQLKHHSPTSPYPSDKIIPFENENGKSLYERTTCQVVMNHLKQSCYVINGNSRAMVNLSESNSRALWDSIRTHDYSIFHTIIAQMNPKAAASKSSDPTAAYNKVPIKVYLAGSSTLIQVPVTVCENDKPRTLESVLRTCLPSVFVGSTVGRAFIHGIDVDLLFSHPILEIWQTFRHMDNFLYITVLVS